MDKVTVFYLVSILLALYALWLAMFRTYHMDHGGPTDDKACLPNIVYVVMLIVSFIPVANVMMFIAFVIISLIGRYIGEDFYVKSWLFDTLGEKEDKEED